MVQIGDSGYDWELAYSYKGSSGDMHYIYKLWYMPAGRLTYPNQHGHYAPNETLVYANLTPRDDPVKTFRWADKDTGINYEIDYGYLSSYVFEWRMASNMAIKTVYMDEKVSPNTVGYITVDIVNTGGDGTFDISLFDGDIELDSELRISVSEGGSERSTLEYHMLNQDMDLMIKLTDRSTGDVVDEETRLVQVVTACDSIVCESTCFGTDMYSTKCVDGRCVQDELLEKECLGCGYVNQMIEAANARADINHDGMVDDKDKAILQGAFGTEIGDSAYCPNADINQDGKIDIVDIGLLAADIGNIVTHILPTPTPAPDPDTPYVQPVSDNSMGYVALAGAALVFAYFMLR